MFLYNLEAKSTLFFRSKHLKPGGQQHGEARNTPFLETRTGGKAGVALGCRHFVAVVCFTACLGWHGRVGFMPGGRTFFAVA
jgi:hypothetical protein